MNEPKLTHIDETGRASMVDVGQKPDTERVATARGSVKMKPKTLQLIVAGNMKKGDVLTTAQLAGIMAAKQTGNLIPLCHPLISFGVPDTPRYRSIYHLFWHSAVLIPWRAHDTGYNPLCSPWTWF